MSQIFTSVFILGTSSHPFLYGERDFNLATSTSFTSLPPHCPAKLNRYDDKAMSLWMRELGPGRTPEDSGNGRDQRDSLPGCCGEEVTGMVS